MRMRGLAVVAGVFLALSMGTAHAISVEMDTSAATWLYFDKCDGALTPGGTWLHDFDMPGQDLIEELPGDNTTAWGANEASYIQQALESQYSDWDYEYADETLGGILYVDWFKAVDVEGDWVKDAAGKWRFVPNPHGAYCLHGAQITTHYDATPYEEEFLDLDWIQLWTEWGSAGSDSYIVDGNEPGDDSPAYFTPADVRTNFIHIPNPGGLIFGDSPYNTHLERQPWSGGVVFTLLLADFDWDLHNITIYDGINWGWRGECVVVPLPATLVLLGVGLACVGAPRLLKRKSARMHRTAS